MIDWLHRPERITAVAAALLLQAALYGVLSTEHVFLSSSTSAPPLITMIMTGRPRRAVPPPPRPSGPQMRNPVIEPLIVQPVLPSAQQARSPASSVDWQAAMQHEVTTELAHAAARPKATFGLPQVPAKRAPLPAFAWDEAHIDRVQRIEHGIIDVGPCTITLAFPIPVCHFGKGTANGDLFEHMRDRPNGEPR